MFYAELKDKPEGPFKRLTGVRPATFSDMCAALEKPLPSGRRSRQTPAPLLTGEADMTLGMLPPDPDFAASGQSSGRGLVIRLARWGIARRAGQTFAQPLSGQRGLTRAVLETLGGTFAPGFGVEVDLTIRALKSGFRVREVKTHFRHHVTGGDWASLRHRARQFRDVARVVFSG